MNINAKDGKVTVQVDGTFSASELLDLVEQLGKARAQIADDPATLSGANAEIKAIAAPSYWTEFNTGLNMSLFAYKHPGLGWMGVALPPVEIARLIGYLGNQLVAVATAASASASSADDNDGRGGGLLH